MMVKKVLPLKSTGNQTMSQSMNTMSAIEEKIKEIKSLERRISDLKLEIQILERNDVDAKINKFLSSHSGKKLINEHSMEEEGVWKVLGEAPNCDFGGTHHQPSLCICRGKLKDVIREAVNLKGFFSWGSGGDIKKITIKDV